MLSFAAQIEALKAGVDEHIHQGVSDAENVGFFRGHSLLWDAKFILAPR
jgi:hypothetical protein